MGAPSKREIDVIAAGHICLDIIPQMSGCRKDKVGELLQPGKLLDVGRATISTGGSVSNTGLALLRLGLKARLMGKVGSDLFGNAVLTILKQNIPSPNPLPQSSLPHGERNKPVPDRDQEVRGIEIPTHEHGVDMGMVVVDDEDTSYTIVLAPPKIDRMFLHNPGTNDTFGFSDIDFEIVSQAKLFHFGYPPLMKKIYENDGEELVRIFKEAKKCGVTTSLDMALPDPESPSGAEDWNAILRDILPYVDIFLPCVEEIMFMLDKDKFLVKRKEAAGGNLIDFLLVDEISHMAERLIECGAGIVGIKCGHRGMYLRSSQKERLMSMGTCTVNYENWSNRELWEPPFHITKFVSATGAGDSCVAGFLTAFLKGESVESVLEYACAVGAESVSAPDAVSGVRSWEETTEMLKKGWEKQEVDIGNSSWKFDGTRKLWRGPNNGFPLVRE